jgi:uncharacterized protein (TIGR00369 family)
MNLMADLPPDLDGRQQLQEMLDRGLQPPMGRTLGIFLIEIGEGRAVFEGTPDGAVYNPIGTVHGGYAAAMLDSACGCAVLSRLPARQAFTTLDLKVSYHRAISAATGTVRAEGRVVTLGRRAAFAEATVVDSSGRLLASATSTLLIADPPTA